MVNKSDFKTSNLWLGFALGMTAGVGLAYFFGTKKGRQILKEIIETAEKFDLEGVKVFKEIEEKLLMTANSPKNSSERKSNSNNINDLINKIRSVVVERKQAKQFYVKNGRLLEKNKK
ncbi:MAG: hypothetical protein QHH09_04505 [Microgenomates group bacterium]|nr:hypothetical protein [Microgenomates group bacterium]